MITPPPSLKPLTSDVFAGCPSPFLQNGVKKCFLKIDKFCHFLFVKHLPTPPNIKLGQKNFK
jgi:hypothetical protein